MDPKLNSHCWYDIKLAAAKKPDLRGRREDRNGPLEGIMRCERHGKGLRNAPPEEAKLDCTYVAEEKTCFSGGS